MSMTKEQVLAVLDAVARGCALHADHCVGEVRRDWASVATEQYDQARAAIASWPEPAKPETESDGPCRESDGCPTELAVLQRFWRAHAAAEPTEPVADPQLCQFYQVSTVAELLAAQESHILKLQDAARRNVKPWEDTFPPTLLPKYMRDSGLAAPPSMAALLAELRNLPHYDITNDVAENGIPIDIATLSCDGNWISADELAAILSRYPEAK